MQCPSCKEEIKVFKGLNCPGCWKYLRTPTTQKAKGIIAGLTTSIGGLSTPDVYGLIGVDDEIPDGALGYNTMFARPCPPSPEHGFVESRVIKTVEELRALQVETKAANPDSEIILMQPITAQWNAIWTPNLLTIGDGHDGATSGKNTISFPLNGLNPIDKHTLAAAGITKSPYMELVGTSTASYFTQLRNGPAIEGLNPDFIPGTITVTKVIQTNGEDLLAWAKLVKTLVNEPGTVVWHPGGSLADHYTVHCREHKVPIFTVTEPIVGNTYTGTDLLPYDTEEMKKGVLAGSLYVPYANERQSAVFTAILALHNSANLRGPHSFWLGAAASLILKLGSAALRGEARHAHNATSKIRSDVYDHYIPKSITFHRAGLSRVTQILTYGFGNPEAHHSFGGKKWGLCGAALVPLFNAVRELFLNPTQETASSLTLALNLAINQAHNGGWWLNKFASKTGFDEIPKGAIRYTIDCVKSIRNLSKIRHAISDQSLAKFSSEVQSWPVTEIENLKWRKVTLDVAPGAFVLNLKAATVPTPQQITIPVVPSVLKALINKTAKLQITQDGRIEFVPPDGQPMTVWAGVPLDPTTGSANPN